MKHINLFHKGVISDLDPSKVSNLNWVFPTMNIRILNRDGKGLIVTNVEGSEEAFDLTDGYMPIGACEHGGICYIASYNDLTEEGEIGCFPSPTEWSTTNTSFTREYSPLMNLETGGEVNELRTSSFTWDSNTRISMFAKPSYDDSVDLYLADHTNPNIIINSGFTQEGNKLARDIAFEDIPTGIKQILSSTIFPDVSNIDLDSGGKLTPGNYFLYIRYLTADYNRTGFIKEVGPIQVSDGNGVLTTQGENYEETTNKKIKLTLTGLDTSYTFFEIGVLRYYGQYGSVFNEVYLVSNYYSIGATGETDIALTGYEEQIILTADELIKPNKVEQICKSHTQIENRYFGSNWKTLRYDRSKLAELALLITTDYIISDLPTSEFHDISVSNISYFASGISDPVGAEHWMQFKDHNNTYEHVSYFHGEIYPYGIVYLLYDGSETEAYPVTGEDKYHPLGPTDTNEKGLYRFPCHSKNESDLCDQMKLLKIRFNVGEFYDRFSVAYGDYTKDVVGYYLVRGDRIDNFITQGLGMRMSTGVGYNDAEDELALNKIPLYKNLVPKVSASKDNSPYEWTNYIYAETFGVNDEFALYSVDNLFSLESLVESGDSYHVEVLYSVTEPYTYASTDTSLEPETYSVDINSLTTVNRTTLGIKQANVYNVREGTNKSYGGSKWFTSVNKYDSFLWWDSDTGSYMNRSMYSPRYIGLKFDEYISSDMFIANIYFNDPTLSDYMDDIVSAYQVSSHKYYKITDLIEISDGRLETVDCFRGDCFTQRTYFRQMFYKEYATKPSEDYEDYREFDQTSPATCYSHGLTIGLMSQNIINTAMRHDDEDHTYYPKCTTIGDPLLDIFQWSTGGDEQDVAIDEAFFYNWGYHKTLSLTSYYGYESTTPITSYDKPTRIRHSSKHVPGSYLDGYRYFDINGYKDYGIEYGGINKIVEQYGNLISFQDDMINQHYTNEQKLTTSTEQADLILGLGSVLDDRVKQLYEGGCQHQWGIVKGKRGIYSIDWKRKKILRTRVAQSEYSGGRYMTTEDLTAGKFVQDWLNSVIDDYNTNSDITNTFPDNTLSGNGIVLGIDKKNNEILFTFVITDGTTDNSKTLVFNEDMDMFIGEYSATPPMYFNINNDMFSIKADYSETTRGDYTVSNNVYQHNKLTTSTFYGVTEDVIISVLANGLMEGQNTSLEVKSFDSIEIETDEIEPERIQYYTEYQSALHTPFISDGGEKFWLDPVYANHKWLIPVWVDDGVDENQFEDDSQLTGTWLKITVKYTSGENVFIKNIITNFEITKA